MNTQPEHQWQLDVALFPSGRVAICCRVDGRELLPEAVHPTPVAALHAIEGVLGNFDGHDEIAICLCGPFPFFAAWTCRSKSAALYWCATMLIKSWPPQWVPVVERRSRSRVPLFSSSERRRKTEAFESRR